MGLHTDVVYGPIHSRRLGLSLGVNVLPVRRKICSLNCVYCQYGWTESVRRSEARAIEWPPPARIAAAVADVVARLHAEAGALDRITIAGHGEPTLHPGFSDVVAALRSVRDARAPGVPLAVLSNSTTLDRPGVRDALAMLDERYMKLDAGDQRTFRRVNASATPVDRIIAALAALPHIVVQAMFVDADPPRRGNACDDAVASWLAAIGKIRPDAVHLYTLARQPAWSAVHPVQHGFLADVARRARAIGVDAIVFD